LTYAATRFLSWSAGVAHQPGDRVRCRVAGSTPQRRIGPMIARHLVRFSKGCREQETTLPNRTVPSRIFPTNRAELEKQACLPSPRILLSNSTVGGLPAVLDKSRAGLELAGDKLALPFHAPGITG
jgi:hypothetical protein